MKYDDNKLASLDQMEQMARAYSEQMKKPKVPDWVKCHILANNFAGFPICCHYFDFAKYLVNFISTKTNSASYKKKINDLNEMLSKNILIFDLFFEDRLHPEQKISFFGNYISANKDLASTLLCLCQSLLPLSCEQQFSTMINETIDSVKLIIFSE